MMRVLWGDKQLEEYYKDSRKAEAKWGKPVAKKYAQRIKLLLDIAEFRELYQYKSLHTEKLKGTRKGEHSIRLTEKDRLILIKGATEDQVIVTEVDIDHYSK